MRVFALVPLEQMFGEKLPNLNRMCVFALVPLEQKFGEKLPNLNRMRVFVYAPCNKRSANLSQFELVLPGIPKNGALDAKSSRRCAR